VKDYPPEAAIDRRTAERLGLRSQLVIPLQAGGSVAHLLAISTVRSERTWPKEAIARLRLAGEIFVNALERKRAEEELQNSYRENSAFRISAKSSANRLRVDISNFFLPPAIAPPHFYFLFKPIYSDTLLSLMLSLIHIWHDYGEMLQP
jgi:hypothetical protein